jgi:hypothetical protein
MSRGLGRGNALQAWGIYVLPLGNNPIAERRVAVGSSVFANQKAVWVPFCNVQPSRVTLGSQEHVVVLSIDECREVALEQDFRFAGAKMSAPEVLEKTLWRL